jgi:hypothetical protein
LRNPDEKIYETRHWYTGYRGELVVHAAKKSDGEVRAALSDPYMLERLAAHDIEHVTDLAFGALIGRVRLVGCCQMSLIPEPSERERLVGCWEPERYAWERGALTTIFSRPIPWKGSQGFFDVPALTEGVAAIEGEHQ